MGPTQMGPGIRPSKETGNRSGAHRERRCRLKAGQSGRNRVLRLVSWIMGQRDRPAPTRPRGTIATSAFADRTVLAR